MKLGEGRAAQQGGGEGKVGGVATPGQGSGGGGGGGEEGRAGEEEGLIERGGRIVP